MRDIDITARREALGRSAMFRVLQPAERDAVLAQAGVRRAARGSVLLRRGDAGGVAFVIIAGRVRIGLTAEDGREVTLGMLGPGEVLGEMSMLDGGEVSADATAIEDCTLLAIERTRFLRLLRENGDLCLRMMAVLCGRLRQSNAALEEMALLDLPGRLARVLLRLAREWGNRTPQGTRIEVRLSQKDLAVLVGGSREKVNRQLRAWEETGAIAKDLGRLVIVQPEALTAPA